PRRLSPPQTPLVPHPALAARPGETRLRHHPDGPPPPRRHGAALAACPLRRLMDEELSEESAVRPAPAEDDARRRYYRLTRLGRRVLTAESGRLEDLVRVIHAKRGAGERRAES